ncbi:MAG TPA: hypothetical protein VMV00_02420 [Candidatus Baltobacteraceae bacterium]|nr:hypothetical protein [Candidatus Baltobacteraceae bacterium]
MGFYGLLVGISLLISISGILAAQQEASALNALSYQYASYNNIVSLSAFAHAIRETEISSSDPDYGGWVESVRASAYADGISVRPLNGAIEISTYSRPYAAAVVRINGT